MNAEQIVSLLACVTVLCGMVLTTLFLHFYFYKKNNPEEWRKRPSVYTRWIGKKEKVRKEDLPSYSKYKEQHLTKKRFEEYLRMKKPFLNPELKTMDLTRPLLTNQKSLATFIRRAYGMEVREYMDLCRLKELKRLRDLGPIRNPIALSVKAGFWGYRDYLRIEKEAAQRSTVQNQ